MSTQRHVIKRQVIELTVRGGVVHAQAIQDELSRIYRQRIVPLLDRHCSRLSAPDRLHRIETLDLDLGGLDRNRLEDDFVAKVDAALSRELAAQIQACEQAEERSAGSAGTQSQLELFVFFVRTGSLPWCADASRVGLLEENLAILLGESPEALARELKKLLPVSRVRQRLVHQYRDDELAALCGLLVPACQASLKRDVSGLMDGVAVDGNKPGLFRQNFWNNILLVAGQGGQHYATLADFYQAVLKRVAAESGHGAMLADVHRAIQADRITVDGQLAGVIAHVVKTAPGTTASISRVLSARLAQLQVDPGPLATAWGRLNNLLPQFQASFKAALLAALNSLPTGASPQNIARHVLQILETGFAGDSGDEISRIIGIFQTVADELHSDKTAVDLPYNQALSARLAQLQADPGALSTAWGRLNNLLPQFQASFKAALLAALNSLPTGASPQSIARHVLQALETGSAGQRDPGAEISGVIGIFRKMAGVPEAFDHTASQRSDNVAVDLRFSQADEYPVTNAGLVILWPFLGHFFGHVGLLDEENCFIDLTARQRAAGLLQMMAAKESNPPEYLLPLNKMLCGLDMEAVFEFGPPLRDDEAQECENLLQAVIAQAPILREMTPDGFRGSFLLRPGILGFRDGMGLLRVERQSYDIVLDRFPWSWEWVRLSWMETPLRVEWEWKSV